VFFLVFATNCGSINRQSYLQQTYGGKVMNTNIDTKFLSNVDKTESCWNWTGSTVQSNYHRYGSFYIGNKKRVRAHRYAYASFIGEIPADMFVCHKCDNPLCVNPSHLFIGTHQDNMNDMVAKKRQAFGRNIGSAVLTEAKVRRIRAMYDKKRKDGSRKYTMAQIAEKFGCSRRNIGDVVNFKNWRHV
jgi:hypothetical protein